ncbi:hypothetical protein IXB50_06885 [Leptothoe spongobia TAU-MAC 1115]|uniref:Uncharacterized protein n=1 Tax=Leptothoe spongobia TAU-MAC 1115 TaxID=1967444 RepID=A0A947GLX0_9CYAN|nr:hypothetical protein [Leptothoe spongobia TAU-MAC 1115]
MTTKFVQMTVELQSSGIDLRNEIEAQLQSYGEPLRWAITSVEGITAHIEAVVTVVDPQPL